MAAGMIPPLALALALTIFKKEFSETEYKVRKNLAVTGMSFITDVHVPIIIGSLLAAMVCAMFQTTVPAPHGGIFVIFLMTNWWGFLIALASGSLISVLLIKIFFILGREA